MYFQIVSSSFKQDEYYNEVSQILDSVKEPLNLLIKWNNEYAVESNSKQDKSYLNLRQTIKEFLGE